MINSEVYDKYRYKKNIQNNNIRKTLVIEYFILFKSLIFDQSNQEQIKKIRYLNVFVLKTYQFKNKLNVSLK